MGKKRFHKEINFFKSNNHKNIVHIFDSGEFDDKLFYVMPLYNKTLRDITKEGELLANRAYAAPEQKKKDFQKN